MELPRKIRDTLFFSLSTNPYFLVVISFFFVLVPYVTVTYVHVGRLLRIPCLFQFFDCISRTKADKVTKNCGFYCFFTAESEKKIPPMMD